MLEYVAQCEEISAAIDKSRRGNFQFPPELRQKASSIDFPLVRDVTASGFDSDYFASAGISSIFRWIDGVKYKAEIR